ncbi:hypothetical protein SAMN04488542_103213 [Fontibacillus panacisegetis]|uniref:Uncharacterized protein n=2 Tax=Fontibacillus panacisegetis TaxID=670482 RepID=A0A1G7GV60_9BACL|nr:hypothetical protein SAMN04488542_103213 [Fontibacillus panacisegetis]
MPKYNLGQNEKTKCLLTMNELCQEIADENETENMESNSVEAIRNKFKNSDQSGIINKLEKLLYFHIEEFTDKYSRLKFLKYLYNIEKRGISKSKSKLYNKTRVRIIDILNKPRLDNIKTDITSKSAYGSITTMMKKNIAIELAEDIQKSKQVYFEHLNSYWDQIVTKLFDYVMTDRALCDPATALKELERIRVFLETRVLSRLPNKSLKLPYKESAFEIFYNILLSHEVLCNDADRVNINYKISLDDPPTKQYSEIFKKYEEKFVVTSEKIPEILKKICIKGPIEDSDIDIIKKMMTGKTLLDAVDVKNLKFAFKYVETLLGWFENVKKIDFSEGYNFSIFTTAIQELISVNANKEIFVNDFYGNKYTAKSMISALKNGEEVEAVIKQAWINKLENRYASNLGVHELIRAKRSVENVIFEIKKKLFIYQNMEDLQVANEMITYFVSRSLISRDVAMDIGAKFGELINKNCSEYRFIICDRGINVLNMFREFLLYEKTMEEVVDDISDMIRDFESEQAVNDYSFIVAREMFYTFEIQLSNTHEKRFLFNFIVNRKDKVLEGLNFMEMISGEESQEKIEIGLGKFMLG